MKKYILCIAFLAVHTSYSQTHYTQLDSLKNKKTIVLNTVVVQQNPFKTPVYATRSDIKLLDLPQGIQTVDKSIIQQQQAIRLSDVVKNINGAYVGSARGGAQESFWSRGYDLSSNNIFKNGFRVNSGSMPEVASLERVEFLKGNSALLFGNVVPGGVVNLVTKVPQFQLGGEISLQAGSYNFYKPSLDIYNGFTKNIAYRLVANYENSKSFRDIVQRERLYINPSLLFKIDKKTEFILQADYLTDDWTPDFGTAMVGKDILQLPRNIYMGAKWSNGTTKQTTVTGLLKHSLNENWKLNFNSSFQDYRRQWIGTERIQPDNNGFWNRPLGKAKNTERIYANQFGILGKFYTYNIKHQVLAGIDWENSFTQSYTYTFMPTTYGSGNVFDFSNFNQGSGMIPEAKNTRLVETTTNRFGIYAQNLISFQNHFKLLLGLRWSWQQADIFDYDLTANPTLKKQEPIRIDKAFSPKIGLVYQPTIHLSIFASYSNSFTPNTGTTIDLQVIKPSILTQYEAGIKKEFFKEKVNASVTLYHIVNSNLAQTAQYKADGSINTDTSIKILSGETTSKGLEVDLTAYPAKGLTMMAGYSYNDMRFTKTSITHGSFIEGDRLTRTPYCTANFSLFYKFQNRLLKGVNIGTLVYYMGKRFGGWNNDYQISNTGLVSVRDRVVPLSDYATLDFSVGYDWKKYSILAKVSNATNTLNYTVHENYSVNPIAPRQVMAIIKYKF
ncbi:iron complex outermembrane receptor protein [Flavobacterium croceum DSM 17960]|uniref:Iron complex outermembrane receptor protein n=1 Tax=Flavobacterium croceum DSM 17960 TaxID=1121886 RepID=A0A2S4N9A6_9FLAO|nr:TonB-dependent siderophore receptor [Flavobacterium croceum]POS02279.1 iron complex outermembrane receptor protein [Flavobacterium croceum DSM 17960]